ncbi:MAG: hypothetical protein ABIP53_02915 [Candidatus Limnocylindrales bacterium]
MPMADDELRVHLSRRVESRELDGRERRELLSAVHDRPKTSALRGWFGWASTAAAAAVAIVLAVVVIGGRPMPAASPTPDQSDVAAGLTASPSASALSRASIAVFTAQELSNMIGSERVGDVVLANARIHVTGTDLKLCGPPGPCRMAVLEDVSGPNLVAMGWRNADEGDGTREEDENEGRWITRVSVPADSGLFAFRILEEAVEYLGPVLKTVAGDIVRSVGDIQAGENSHASDVVFPVHGWLVRAAGPISCPAPQRLIEGEHPDLRWYCGGGGYLSAEPVRTLQQLGENSIGFITPDGLRAQNGAYDEFAPNPDSDDQGSIPREGVYLVRSAGCPAVTLDQCPVWSMIGRVKDVGAPPESTPAPPQPTPTPSESPSASQPPDGSATLQILSREELENVALQSAVAGRVVVAEAAVEPSPEYVTDPRCLPPLCVIGRLAGAGDSPVVLIRQTTGSPEASTLGAFRLLGDALEFLGPVRPDAAGGAWGVTDIRSGTPEGGVLYAVDAWLTQSPDIGKCRPAPEGTDDDDLGYWCNASWLTPQRVDLPRPGKNDFEHVPPDALQVQNRAYTLFAFNARADVDGVEPWHDAYLIRQVGCPSFVLGDCPAWELIANVDTRRPNQPTACINSSTIVDRIPITSQQLAGFSDVIVVATVNKVGPSFWNSPNGERPTTMFHESGILTRFETLVERALKGDGSQAEWIVNAGGVVGCDRSTYSESPDLVEGMRYVVFLRTGTYQNPDAEPNPYVMEAWPVLSDGHVVDPSNGALLSLDELGPYLLQPVETPAPVVR